MHSEKDLTIYLVEEAERCLKAANRDFADSDYKSSKEVMIEQIDRAEYFLQQIKEYLEKRINLKE
jgi:uncharacterized protein (UPF0332 family)